MDLEARDFGTAEAKPTPYFPPIVVNRAARPSRSRIRVVLLNVKGGHRLRAVEACLKRPPLDDADVILLCEANSGTRQSQTYDVASELAAALDMSYAHIPEFGIMLNDGSGERKIVEHWGNAILCRQPLDDVVAVAMPNPRKSRRAPGLDSRFTRVGTPTGLYASARFGGETITLGVAHLNSRCTPAKRERQMACYMAEFPPVGRAIFGGDLNTTTTELKGLPAIAAVVAKLIASPSRFRAPEPREPLFERMKELGLEIDGVNVKYRATFTFSGLIPHFMRPKLDWLAIRGLRPVAGSAAVIAPKQGLFSRRASDHDFVTVELEL
jgi:endonuclease/exonuclease/phosphatase family metal-dependent hydrolase